ncbi:hypothetical protein K438DRAFT_1980974 [Mycena galopus ATCC 62051]|nr:hypothetical protein K438DRAFT_1980974 [Mycena galopus ATCC 62051]
MQVAWVLTTANPSELHCVLDPKKQVLTGAHPLNVPSVHSPTMTVQSEHNRVDAGAEKERPPLLYPLVHTQDTRGIHPQPDIRTAGDMTGGLLRSEKPDVLSHLHMGTVGDEAGELESNSPELAESICLYEATALTISEFDAPGPSSIVPEERYRLSAVVSSIVGQDARKAAAPSFAPEGRAVGQVAEWIETPVDDAAPAQAPPVADALHVGAVLQAQDAEAAPASALTASYENAQLTYSSSSSSRSLLAGSATPDVPAIDLGGHLRSRSPIEARVDVAAPLPPFAEESSTRHAREGAEIEQDTVPAIDLGGHLRSRSPIEARVDVAALLPPLAEEFSTRRAREGAEIEQDTEAVSASASIPAELLMALAGGRNPFPVVPADAARLSSDYPPSIPPAVSVFFARLLDIRTTMAVSAIVRPKTESRTVNELGDTSSHEPTMLVLLSCAKPNVSFTFLYLSVASLVTGYLDFVLVSSIIRTLWITHLEHFGVSDAARYRLWEREGIGTRALN